VSLEMGCQDCGAEVRGKQKFCKKCRRKRQNASTKRCNQKRYKSDPEFRKDMLRRTLEWQAKHPERHWAITVIKNHKITGKVKIYFSLDQLEEMAFKTKICPYCGILLNYGKKGKKGFDPHSPSMDNINGVPALLIKDVQIICAQCNSAKQRMTREQFEGYIDRLWHCIFPDNEWNAEAEMFRRKVIEFAKLHHIKEVYITEREPIFSIIYKGTCDNLLLWKLRTLWHCAYEKMFEKLLNELKTTYPN
jgi:hypothetical protein